MKLTILSFNVLAQPWIDHKLKQEVCDARHLRRSYRVKRQIELFKLVDADVLLLQEVTPNVLVKYRDALPQYDVPVCFSQMHWQPSTSTAPINGNAVLWRKGLLHDVKCSLVTLDAKLGNYAAVVEGKLAKNTKKVKFVSLHLEYGMNKTSAAARLRQFKRLFPNTIAPSDAHVVIGGDFNMGHPHWVIDDCVSNHAFMDVIPPKKKVTTHPFSDRTVDDAIIDHVLTRGFKTVKTIVPQCESIGETMQVFGSDHFPIVTTIRLE